MAAPSAQQDQDSGPLAVYSYDLPPELVAHKPARHRAAARLLVLPRSGGEMRHKRAAHLVQELSAGDLLVLNDTQVVPARIGARKPSGGRVELLLLSPARPLAESAGGEVHSALARPGRSLHPGMELAVTGRPGARLRVLRQGPRGRLELLVPGSGLALLEAAGQVPLPPYIKRPQGPSEDDRRRYQTVYAARPGAVAAPTAGLHFSTGLLAALARRGIKTARLTLHVGYGTFAEPSAADLAAGRLHPEWVELPRATCRAVATAKAAGKRVVAVGTTAMRALEWRAGPGGAPRPGSGWCDLLIGEGHHFKVADGLLTNFHLPRTSLLMLVAAMAGRERVLAAYQEAVRRSYRFYSFGDAMLII